MLERIIYKSKAADGIGSLCLFNILSKARANNASVGITGHLIFDGTYFTQCIEGSTEAIDRLWESLVADQRHQDIKIVSRAPIKMRRYGLWSMSFSSYKSLNGHNMPGFFPLDDHTVEFEVERLIKLADTN
jgi:hypothetical protein